MRMYKRVLALYRPDQGRIAIVLIGIVLATGANLLKPLPLAVVIDSVLGSKPFPAILKNWEGEKTVWVLAKAGLLILVLHALQGALSSFYQYLSIRIGLGGLARIRNQTFDRLQRLSLRYHQGAQAGDLLYRASWDTFAFQTLFQQGFVSLVGALVSLGLMVMVMWRLHPGLTWVTLLLVPLLGLIMRSFSAQMSEQASRAQQHDSQVTAALQQAMAALPMVQSYATELEESRRFHEETERACAARSGQHRAEILYWLAVTIAFAIGVGAITGLGAAEVLAGSLSLGDLTIFLAYVGQLYDPLNQLSNVGAVISRARASVHRVAEILEAPEAVVEAPNARPVVRSTETAAAIKSGATALPLAVIGELAFIDVHFGYIPGREILQGVTFQVTPGQSVAIVGPSGSGKSTLLSLVPRFFDPQTGVVRLDGVDLRELCLRDLRRQVALVLQEPLLLRASIADNIRYGSPHATPDEVRAAAAHAHAEQFIMKLPEGFETVVGDGAARLSVGEKQRINVARALLKNAPILLLDEPTSALDAESEGEVIAELIQQMKRRTTLLVAHRLSTLERVDKILVLQDGRVSEFGSPTELLRQNGYFARVWARRSRFPDPDENLEI